MIGRILFLLIPILGAIAMWYFYQDALWILWKKC